MKSQEIFWIGTLPESSESGIFRDDDKICYSGQRGLYTIQLRAGGQLLVKKLQKLQD